jgi:hypothetical protein
MNETIYSHLFIKGGGGEKMNEEFVFLSEIVKKPGQLSGKRYTTEELLDREFVILGIEFFQGDFGEYAIVYLADGYYRITSGVLLKQAKTIQSAIEQGKFKGIKVKLVKKISKNKRGYLMFE